MSENRPIALLTDFGMRSPYVAAMKGVIASIAPAAPIHDLSHEIAPGNIREGALFLDAILPYWPARAIHVCVVDPGVGSGRRRMAIDSDLGTFIGPDNGLFTFVLRRARRRRIVALENRRYFLPRLSSTFHGRDAFAPVAAHLAAGADLGDLGPPIGDPVSVEFPEPRLNSDGSVSGEVIEVDRFGNLMTNIETAALDPGRRWIVRIGSQRIEGILDHYAQAANGALMALTSSSGRLEVAVNRGNAAERLALGLGTAVSASPEPRRP